MRSYSAHETGYLTHASCWLGHATYALPVSSAHRSSQLVKTSSSCVGLGANGKGLSLGPIDALRFRRLGLEDNGPLPTLGNVDLTLLGARGEVGYVLPR